MSGRMHSYEVDLHWTGNGQQGSVPFRRHVRDYTLSIEGKPPIAGSSDRVFRGDPSRWNPEDLLVASLAACHKLWYMGLCVDAGITVVAYDDHATGTMVEDETGAGQFVEVVLRPDVTIAVGGDLDAAMALHEIAHARCFIARSVNFAVEHEPSIRFADPER